MRVIGEEKSRFTEEGIWYELAQLAPVINQNGFNFFH